MPSRKYTVLFAIMFAVLMAVGLFALLADDAGYQASEWASFGRFRAYDTMIAKVAERRGIDPLLVKAVVWQESRFHPEKLGAHGERGLMQVTEPAAQDWVEAEGIGTFVPEDLLDAKTNLEAGTWYLAKALKHWSGQEDPLPFALGEYNAGRSRVKRWSGGAMISAEELDTAMDIPSTRAYIAAVRKRYEYYKRHESGPSAP